MSAKLVVERKDLIKCQIEKAFFTPKSATGMRTAPELTGALEQLTVVAAEITPKDGLQFEPSTVRVRLADGSSVPTFGVIKSVRGMVMIFSCFRREGGSWSVPPGNPVTPVNGYQGPDSNFGAGQAQFIFAFPSESAERIVCLEIDGASSAS
jgi:hypothetical protein